MGLFDNLFGGKKSYNRALSRMEKGYESIRQFAGTEYENIISEFLKERTANAEVYSTNYREAVDRYSSVMAQSREAFKAAGAEAYKTLEAGRESTLALLKQETDAAVARQTLSGMLTGLSNTTFGQAAINAVAAQGALQAGAVREQYAQTLYQAQMAQAGALAGMEQQAAQSLFGAGLGSAQYLSGQYQQYTTAAQAARAARLQNELQLRTTPLQSRYSAEMAKATQDMAAGSAFGGALVGAGLGALGEGIGSAFGGPMGGQIGRQAGYQTASPFIAGA
jgi:hypothetical protein